MIHVFLTYPGGGKLSMAIGGRLVLAALAALTCSIAYGSKPNILMFVFDDMRPTLTPYGEPGASTPNIQQIANQNGATTFENVYVQQAFCGPSRTSFLTGRRPDSTKLYDLGSYWREVAGNFSTFPELIKGAGYTTHSIGKVFHPLSSMKHANHTDDYPYSWSEPGWHPPTQHYKQAPVCPPLAGLQLTLFIFIFTFIHFCLPSRSPALALPCSRTHRCAASPQQEEQNIHKFTLSGGC